MSSATSGVSSSAISRLKNDEDYYGEYGQQWLSASTLKKYLKGDCPPEDKMNEYALRFGGLFHQAILEPDKYEADTTVTEEEKAKILDLKVALETSFEYHIMEDVTDVEVPYIGQWNGVKLKCKVDAETDKYLVDLKTTSNLDITDYTAKHFGYHISAYQYWYLTGKPMYFLYVEKGSGRTKLVYPDKKFYEDGRRDWIWAMRNYKHSLHKQWTFVGNVDMADGRFVMDKVNCKVEEGKMYTWTFKEEHLRRRR